MANRNRNLNATIVHRRFLPFGTRFVVGNASPGGLTERSGNRGIALVTVLLVVALLIAVVVEFNRIALADIQVSNNFVDEKKILYTTMSGVNAICGLLELDREYSQSDNLLEDWTRGETYFESASMLLDEGKVSGSITDEDGKICVNSLIGSDGQMNNGQFALWRRLLQQPGFRLNEQEAMTIIYSIKDWLDPDDEVSDIYGAENTTYLPLGYECKNGRMETLEELLFVNGMTREIFYGDENREGLRSSLSVYGGGAVNINTAPIPVLLALSPLMNESIAQELHAYRTEPTNRSDLQSKEWYQKIWPYDELIPEGLLATRSSYFTLRIRGTLRESRKNVRAVVRRTAESANIVYWQETAQ